MCKQAKAGDGDETLKILTNSLLKKSSVKVITATALCPLSKEREKNSQALVR